MPVAFLFLWKGGDGATCWTQCALQQQLFKARWQAAVSHLAFGISSAMFVQECGDADKDWSNTARDKQAHVCCAGTTSGLFFFFLSQGNSAKMKKFCIKNSLKYNGGEIKASQFLNSQAARGISGTFILQKAVTILRIIHILSITFKKGQLQD